jgi:hypothetical protein
VGSGVPVDAIGRAVDEHLWLDTHEHLLEPATRACGPGAHRLQPCADFALLFFHYAQDDLAAAGMPAAERARLYAPETAPGEKWGLLQPWWERCRHTGYLRAVAETLRGVYGVDTARLDAAACERVSAEMAARASRPGFYAEVLARAGVQTCQVNSLEVPLFQETAEPALLLQDMSLLPFLRA